MPFAPDEIASMSFATVWRGYDADAVEAFLRAVSVEVRQLQHQLEIAAPSRCDDPFDEAGSQVSGILRAARESGEEIRSEATEWAAQTLYEAEEEAAGRVEAATLEAEGMIESARVQAETLLAAADAQATMARAEAEKVNQASLRRRHRLDALDQNLTEWLTFVRDEVRGVGQAPAPTTQTAVPLPTASDIDDQPSAVPQPLMLS